MYYDTIFFPYELDKICELLTDFCMHDNHLIQYNIDKKLFHSKHSKLNHILHVDKTSFLKPMASQLFAYTYMDIANIYICI